MRFAPSFTLIILFKAESTETKYFSATFSPTEVLFFENHNAKSLAFSLDNLIISRTDYTIYGENLFSTIKEKYTWEKIFEFKVKIIRNYLK